MHDLAPHYPIPTHLGTPADKASLTLWAPQLASPHFARSSAEEVAQEESHVGVKCPFLPLLAMGGRRW